MGLKKTLVLIYISVPVLETRNVSKWYMVLMDLSKSLEVVMISKTNVLDASEGLW